jgi:hypothetical protein
MTFFGRLSSLFRNSGSRDRNECDVMPTYSQSVASIACARFTRPCSLPKDLRSRGEVDSDQSFALTWRGSSHCNAPAANHSPWHISKYHFRTQPDQSAKCSTRYQKSGDPAVIARPLRTWQIAGFISHRKQPFSFLRKVYVV